jgi:hypothetical protein
MHGSCTCTRCKPRNPQVLYECTSKPCRFANFCIGAHVYLAKKAEQTAGTHGDEAVRTVSCSQPKSGGIPQLAWGSRCSSIRASECCVPSLASKTLSFEICTTMSKPFAFWVRFATIVSLSTMASIHATANGSTSNGNVRERYPFPTPHRATSDWSTRLGGVVAVGGMLLGSLVGTHDEILVLHGQPPPTTTWLIDFIDDEFEGTAREPVNSVPSMVEDTHVVICDTSSSSSSSSPSLSSISSISSISAVPEGGDDWDLFTNPGTKPTASPIFEDPMAQFRAPSVDALFGAPADPVRSEFLGGRTDSQIDGEPIGGGSPADGGRNTRERDVLSHIEAPVPRLEQDRISSAMLSADAQESADVLLSSEIHRDAFRGAEYRVWSDNTGTFSVTARVAIIFGDSVRLLKENGRTTTVPIRRLSEADRLYVQWVAVSLTRRATQSSQR